MNALIDVTGERYGRLVAIRRVPSETRRTKWLFKCDCGVDFTTDVERVRSGMTKSCGCLKIDKTRERSITHGHSVGRRSTRTLKAYQHAKGRCFSPTNSKFPQYGGRGISMCKEWADDFGAFLRDMGEAPEGKTLDRIDPHGNYEPGNCRWATTHEQARTRTDNVIVEHEGRRMVLKDFATLMNVKYKSLHALVRYQGKTPAEAVAILRH